MKKQMAALVVGLGIVGSSAAEWMQIASSDTGVVLMADIEAVQILGTEAKPDEVVVVGDMAYMNDKDVLKFKSQINASQCLKYKQGLVYNILERGSVQQYTWSMSGVKLVDAQGQFLCQYLVELINLNQNKSSKPTKPKVSM